MPQPVHIGALLDDAIRANRDASGDYRYMGMPRMDSTVDHCHSHAAAFTSSEWKAEAVSE
jgi:hypothetical protein